MTQFLKISTLFGPLNANPTKWSNKFKKIVDSYQTNCLTVFDHFVWFVLEGLTMKLTSTKPSSKMISRGF